MIRGLALLILMLGLWGVSPALSQEHEVPQAEFMVGYSYLRSADINFNGWKATLSKMRILGSKSQLILIATMPQEKASIALPSARILSYRITRS